jgi:large subunit ribosomal protein L22
MRAFLKNNRQAPRKVRLVAREVVGKNVKVALSELSFMPHKASFTLSKLISSAIANAKQADASIKEEDLFVKNIMVDKGITYKRYRPRAFGRASIIHKESSHVRVVLDVDKTEAKDDKKKEKKVEEKKVKKEEKKTDKKSVKKEEKVKEEKKDKTKTDKKEENK